MIGKVLAGRYKIIYLLGSGGFGRAYLAHELDASYSDWRVIKHFQPLISPLSTMTLETAKRLFDTEAQTLKALGEDDRIPTIFDYFEEDKQFYLVTEFVEGHELSQELEYGKFNEYQIYDLLKKILDILLYLQNKNVIHRDITPDNLMRRRKDKNLVLIDFGAVKQVILDNEGKPRRSRTIAIGKDTYMPDEQANGRPGFYSDVYAVGVICIQAYIGYLPEKDYDSGEFIWPKHTISPELAHILDKMTRSGVRERYQSALEVIHDLNRLSSVFTISPMVTPFKYNSAAVWYNRGNELKNKKHHEEALLIYKEVIKLKPTHYKACFNLGITFSYLKHYEAAIDYYNKAIEIKSKSSEAWFHKGIALHKLCRYEEALDAFNNAILFQPYYAVALLYKGFTLNLLNKYQEAAEAYNEAVRLRPGYVEILRQQN